MTPGPSSNVKHRAFWADINADFCRIAALPISPRQLIRFLFCLVEAGEGDLAALMASRSAHDFLNLTRTRKGIGLVQHFMAQNNLNMIPKLRRD
jgi:hypothetical protein